jgi:hypothetical protein
MTQDCTHIRNCPMYSLLQLSGTLRTWQSRYCKADYAQCARYKLSIAGKSVPQNLMPNGSLLRLASGPVKPEE